MIYVIKQYLSCVLILSVNLFINKDKNKLQITKTKKCVDDCFYKRYFILDQQIARHFAQYSKSVSTLPSILCKSNN